jgi:HSP20 family molecular chaperone IbpA
MNQTVLRLPRWPIWPSHRSAIPIEEYSTPDTHVIRAQLPDLDPDGELAVMVADNEVTIEVQPQLRVPTPLTSEFERERGRRTIALPRGAKDETLTASYDDRGILQLTVAVARPVPIGRCVPIDRREPLRRRVGIRRAEPVR